MDASHVYVRAWALGCFSLSEDADRVGGQLRGDKQCPFSGVTKSGKSLEEGAGERCSGGIIVVIGPRDQGVRS